MLTIRYLKNGNMHFHFTTKSYLYVRLEFNELTTARYTELNTRTFLISANINFIFTFLYGMAYDINASKLLYSLLLQIRFVLYVYSNVCSFWKIFALWTIRFPRILRQLNCIL